MKKLIPLVVGPIFCTCVMAQSSVTLYGIIDAGVTYVSNTGGQHTYLFDDGITYGNRVGLSGTEDLGGGNKAVFKLENGFRLGNGQLNQGGAMFGRQAYVVSAIAGERLPSVISMTSPLPIRRHSTSVDTVLAMAITWAMQTAREATG